MDSLKVCQGRAHVKPLTTWNGAVGAGLKPPSLTSNPAIILKNVFMAFGMSGFFPTVWLDPNGEIMTGKRKRATSQSFQGAEAASPRDTHTVDDGLRVTLAMFRFLMNGGPVPLMPASWSVLYDEEP